VGKTSIAWTDATWNPVTGCKAVSPGCANCFAARLAGTRLAASPRYAGLATVNEAGRGVWSGEVRLHPDRLDEPLRWRRPLRVFVCDMADLFHEDVPDDFLLRCFDVMRRCTWAGGQNCGRIGGDGHTFQVLTKRAGRMREFCSRLRWDGERVYLGDVGGPHLLRLNKGIWLGVSAEDQRWADERIPLLLQTPAAVRFVSAEPLLGPVDLSAVRHQLGAESFATVNVLVEKDSLNRGYDRPRLDWVIVGGESGPDARPMCLEWARSLVAQCRGAGIPVFVKQLGTNVRGLVRNGLDHDRIADALGSTYRLRDRKGGDMSEWPEDLRVREWPPTHTV
jgi:protein gp37